MFEIIITISIVTYIIRSMIFHLGSIHERNKKFRRDESYRPFVSVVVPSRNEEHNIRDCIKSVAANDYPIDKFEIIAINDRSTDKTGEIIDSMSNEVRNLHPLHVSEGNANHNLRGKPGALQAGISKAKGEIILMTDADCRVPDNWISTIVHEYSNEKIRLMASYTTIRGKKFFHHMQAIEWFMLHTMASAGLTLKQPLGCYGNNMSIRRNDFFDLGGYEKIKFSVTEDLALLRELVRSGRLARYFANVGSMVETMPCNSIKELIDQHHRWARGGMSLGWRAVLFVTSTFMFWLGLILSIFLMSWQLTLAILAIRLICDTVILLPVLNRLRERRLYPWLIPSILVLMIWELVVPFLLLNPHVRWKGQIFAKTN